MHLFVFVHIKMKPLFLCLYERLLSSKHLFQINIAPILNKYLRSVFHACSTSDIIVISAVLIAVSTFLFQLTALLNREVK